MPKRKQQIGHGGGKTRKFGGAKFSRKVGAKTKRNAQTSAGISRNQGKRARVVKVGGGWAVYTKG